MKYLVGNLASLCWWDYYLLSPSILFFAHLIVLHFLFHCTFYSYFSFFTIHMLLCCYFYIICIFILLHCPLSGPDFTYISLLIIPCIIYYVTNKQTLTLMSHSNVDDNESSCTLLCCFLRLVPLRWRSLTHGEVLCLSDIRLRPPAVDWWPPSLTDCRRRVVSTAWWQRVPLEDRCVTRQNQQNMCSCGVILLTLSCMCVAGSCYGDRSLSSVAFILPQTVTHAHKYIL